MQLKPRFTLRTLFVLVALASIPLGSCTYQLNWIRERRSFIQNETAGNWRFDEARPFSPAPWSLRLFGERGAKEAWVYRDDKERATRLFPEAKIVIWKEWEPP